MRVEVVRELSPRDEDGWCLDARDEKKGCWMRDLVSCPVWLGRCEFCCDFQEVQLHFPARVHSFATSACRELWVS